MAFISSTNNNKFFSQFLQTLHEVENDPSKSNICITFVKRKGFSITKERRYQQADISNFYNACDKLVKVARRQAKAKNNPELLNQLQAALDTCNKTQEVAERLFKKERRCCFRRQNNEDRS